MSEIDLKAYYESENNETIDIVDQVMNTIESSRKKTSRVKVRVIAIAAAVMIFIMGCGYLMTQTFYGPDGEILWERIIEPYDEAEEVADIIFSYELDQGQFIHVQLNDESVVNTYQEPFITDNFDETLKKSLEHFDMNLENQYDSFTFDHSKSTGMFGNSEIDSVDKMNELIKTEEPAVLIEEGDINGVTSFNHIYTMDENILRISVSPWLGNEVHYSEDNSKSNTILEVNGYEGVISSDGDNEWYEIILNDNRLYVHYPAGSLEQETLITIIEAFIN